MIIPYSRCLKTIPLSNNVSKLAYRPFLHWLTIVFNKIDTTRIQKYGADRVCAEWCLRNGAGIQWVGSKTMLTDYNLLPPEDTKLFIKKIDATDSSISHYGFLHLQNCNHIHEFILDSCGYIENEALKQLALIKNSLYHLKIANCGNITEEGLEHIQVLTQLRTLRLFNLNYVQDKKEIIKMLSTYLPNCQIIHDFEPKQNISQKAK